MGIKPDLVTYGKIIGGGFPVGAYCGKAKIMDMIAPNGPVYQAGTLSANPFGMRAGLATLKKVEKENVYKNLEERTKWFCEELKKRISEQGKEIGITYFASLFWLHGATEHPIRSLTEIPKGQGPNYAAFFHACLDNGLYLAPSAYEVNFLSLAHSEEVLEQALTIMTSAFLKHSF
jgi:glutamate-1-semialdehyde 2,1-aminomutase